MFAHCFNLMSKSIKKCFYPVGLIFITSDFLCHFFINVSTLFLFFFFFLLHLRNEEVIGSGDYDNQKNGMGYSNNTDLFAAKETPLVQGRS